MKENIEANKELGMLSKQLATIMLDVPVDFNAEDFELNHPDTKKVTEIFQELEFRQLLTNFLKTFQQGTEPEQSNNDQIVQPKVTEQKQAGAGQFSLFDANGDSAVAIAVGRKNIHSVPHFYQTVESGMATSIFIKTLGNQIHSPMLQ